jgi:type I restriction enzyme M protein
MPSFGKRIPLTREHFQAFGQCYGDDPNGNSPRVDQGEEGRFRCFTREQITKRGENLDLSWLRDESLQSGDDLPEPEVIATEIMEKLRIATKEMEALMVLLEGEEAAEAVSASVGLPTVE